MAISTETILDKIKTILGDSRRPAVQRAVGWLYAGFEKLFAAFPQPAYVRGANGDILAANALADDLLGLNKPHALLSVKSMREDLFAEVQVFKTKKPAAYSFTYGDNHGNTHRARVIKTPVVNESGKVYAVVTIFNI